MHYVSDSVLLDNFQHCRFIAQIHLFKCIFRIGGNLLKVNEMASVRKTIKVDELFDPWVVDNVMNHVRANESSTTGNKQIHFSFVTNSRTRPITTLASNFAVSLPMLPRRNAVS